MRMLLLLLMLRMIYRNYGGEREREGVRYSTGQCRLSISMPVSVSIEEGTNTGKGRCVVTSPLPSVVHFYTVPTIHLTPRRRKKEKRSSITHPFIDI